MSGFEQSKLDDSNRKLSVANLRKGKTTNILKANYVQIQRNSVKEKPNNNNDYVTNINYTQTESVSGSIVNGTFLDNLGTRADSSVNRNSST